MMVNICYNLTWNILSTLAFKNSSSSWGSEVLPIRSNTEATTSSISILKYNKDINQMKMKLKIGTQTFPKVFSSLFSCQATCHLRHESDILSRSKIVFTYLKITYYYLFCSIYFWNLGHKKIIDHYHEGSSRHCNFLWNDLVYWQHVWYLHWKQWKCKTFPIFFITLFPFLFCVL